MSIPRNSSKQTGVTQEPAIDEKPLGGKAKSKAKKKVEKEDAGTDNKGSSET